MTPLQTWLFLALCAVLLWAAVHEGGRRVDWVLDRFFADLRPDSGPVPPLHDDCPCRTDPNYHEWVALQLMRDDEAREGEDHR